MASVSGTVLMFSANALRFPRPTAASTVAISNCPREELFFDDSTRIASSFLLPNLYM
jgi:hypothetical protein